MNDLEPEDEAAEAEARARASKAAAELQADLDRVVHALTGAAVLASTEAELGAAVRRLFDAAGVTYENEVWLRGCQDHAPEPQTVMVYTPSGAHERSYTPKLPRIKTTDRIDFMVSRVGVELKLRESASNVIRQLYRYAASNAVGALVLVTTSRQLAAGMPTLLRNKRVVTVCLGVL